jgi:phage anti-repressor protein
MNISVREFLRMAQYDASDEEMKQVCLAVNLWEDLETKTKNQKFLSERMVRIFQKVRNKSWHIILKRFKEETIICIAHDEEIKRRFCKTIEVGKEVFILHDRNLFQRNRKHKILRGEISRSV